MRRVIALSLALIGCTDETVSGYADRSAVYVLTDIDGVPFEARATITFPEPGQASGQGPCNAWSASQSAPYPWIELGPIAATKRACADLAEEQRFFDALQSATLAEINGRVLILSGLSELVFVADDI